MDSRRDQRGAAISPSRARLPRGSPRESGPRRRNRFRKWIASTGVATYRKRLRLILIPCGNFLPASPTRTIQPRRCS
jgi:hypothetical protein